MVSGLAKKSKLNPLFILYVEITVLDSAPKTLIKTVASASNQSSNLILLLLAT